VDGVGAAWRPVSAPGRGGLGQAVQLSMGLGACPANDGFVYFKAWR